MDMPLKILNKLLEEGKITWEEYQRITSKKEK